MNQKSPSSLKLVLTRGEGTGRITVDMDAFFDFSFALAEELQDLVNRSQPAAPRTMGLRASAGSSHRRRAR